MTYLLDVNVLLAFAYYDHSLHDRAHQWIKHEQSTGPEARHFVTCSIVELGFIRIAPGKKNLAPNLAAARADLERVRTTLELQVIEDSLDASRLPRWVNRPDQTTDGHLLELATHHQIRFATLDAGIPGAELIPYESLPSEVREPAYAGCFDMTTHENPENFIYDENEVPIPGYPFPRWAIDPITGYPYVRGRPGAVKVTTEDVKEMLKDFP